MRTNCSSPSPPAPVRAAACRGGVRPAGAVGGALRARALVQDHGTRGHRCGQRAAGLPVGAGVVAAARPLFGLYAIAELGWSFGLVEYFIADDAGARDAWLAAVLAGRAVFMYATARFAILVTGLETGWLRRMLQLYLAIKIPLIALMVMEHSTRAMVLANVVVNVVMALSIVAMLLRAAVTRPERERVAIAAALGLTLLVSMLDLLHVWWIGDYYWDSSVTRYVSLIFSLTMELAAGRPLYARHARAGRAEPQAG
ncbi:hypothetical protein ACU4GD_16255 [Cupriavidus basilensis]